MKNLFFAFCLLFFFGVYGQSARSNTPKEAGKYIKEFCELIRKNALYADSINWDRLDAKLEIILNGENKVETRKLLIDTVLATLRRAGDKHSGFIDAKETKRLTNSNYKIMSLETRNIGDGFCYIKIPPFFSIDLSASEIFAVKIQNQIRQIDQSQNIKDWIIDLRGNSGGNMHPMIKGLSCLIGEGTYGYAIYPDKEIAMSMENGQTGYIKLKLPYRLKNPVHKIAVLIDSSTASSGEFTAIAFKSLPNVRFFGQPSAGFTTSNQTFKLSDGSILYLATSYMADRKRIKYLPNIIPDVITHPDKNDENDSTIAAAKAWLKLDVGGQ